MPVQIVPKYETPDSLQGRVHTEWASLKLGLAGLSFTAISAEDRGFFCPGDKAIAHNHLQLAVLPVVITVIYTSE